MTPNLAVKVRILRGVQNVKLGFLVVTVLTIVSKLQDSSNKLQMDSERLSINLGTKLKWYKLLPVKQKIVSSSLTVPATLHKV